MIFATKGEQILNEDGSLHATVARDIPTGETIHPSAFEFVGKPPIVGSPVSKAIWLWMKGKKHVGFDET